MNAESTRTDQPHANQDFYQTILEAPLPATIEYYAQCLKNNGKAIGYLARHGLSSEAALQVGFADRSLGKQLPSKLLKIGRAIRSQLETLGVYRPNGREHFRGMLTVPLTDLAGRVTGIYGRRLDRHGSDSDEQTIGSGFFNARALSQYDELIVTESVLDAWAFYTAGYQNVICPIARSLTMAECEKLKRVLLTSPTIDCEVFSKCEIHRLKFPDNQTAYGYMLAHRDSPGDPLGRLIRAAAWIQGTARNDSPRSDVLGLEEIELREAPKVAPPLTSPVPIAIEDLQVTQSDDEVTILSERRRWRIRGLNRNMQAGVMKVNLLVYNERTDRFHVDCFDLYHARSRRVFTAEAADEIGIDEAQLRSELGRVLLKLEQLQAEGKQLEQNHSKIKPLTDDERTLALDFLKSDNLVERILEDFDACGIVGDRNAKLTGYLAATSRLLDRPLGLIIQSSSAAGKSSLMQAILSFMPDEQQLACSAMTGQSLYYAGNLDLRHKILSIVEEEGVRDASYALKLLQSEGKLSIASTTRESGSGRTALEVHQVEGPVALLLTTTTSDMDPELMNRCLVISVDESSSQTEAIHRVQRQAEMLTGFQRRIEGTHRKALHQNAQRLLRPLAVANPYADQLTFVGSQARHRRDHVKYLGLIRSVALLHQYQRDVKQTVLAGKTIDYIEVSRQDIALASQIADWALGRSIDELPSPSRRLLFGLYDWLNQQAHEKGIALDQLRFTRRAAREALGWNATQLAYHLEQLCQFEYTVAFGRGSGKLYQYGLLYDGRGREGEPALPGLVDVATLKEPVLCL
jgi:hypothetical protein